MRKAGLNVRQVEEKLGWLRKFVPQVRRWGEMLAVIGTAEHYVRHEGIHAKAAEELAAVLPKPAIPAVQRLRKQLLEFVADARAAGAGRRTAVGIERSLGVDHRQVQERGGRAGPARTDGDGAEHRRVGRATWRWTTVQAAMTEITTHEVWNWCRSHLGATVQSVRQRIRQALHPEQKQKTLRLESG